MDLLFKTMGLSLKSSGVIFLRGLLPIMRYMFSSEVDSRSMFLTKSHKIEAIVEILLKFIGKVTEYSSLSLMNLL